MSFFRRHALKPVAFLSLTWLDASLVDIIAKAPPPPTADFPSRWLVQLDGNQTKFWMIPIFVR